MIALDDRPPRVAPWLAGIGVSALIHAGIVLVLTRVSAPAPVFEPALMLELAPLTQAPVTPPTPEPAEEPAPTPPTAAREMPTEPEMTPQATPVQEQPPVHQEAPAPAIAETVEPAPVPAPATETPPEPTKPEPAVPDSPPAPEAAVPEPPVPVPPPRPVVRPAPRPPAAPRPVAPRTQPAPEAVATPTAPAAAPPVAQASAQATADWRARLLAHLNRFKRYPAAALMRRVQGVAYVHLLLMPDGTAKDIRLHASSGAAALDEEAVALIGRATPLPPRPDSGATELVIPVQFAVR